VIELRDRIRDATREVVVHAPFFVPAARRRRLDRWLRGCEELRKLRAADVAFVSWAKSGRTWVRLMVSRFYQLHCKLPESSFLEFDNLKRQDPAIPSVFFTHGNYLRDYTGDFTGKQAFYDARVLLLARDPRDVAVSQYFQWKHRMRGWKRYLNDYPEQHDDLSLYEFVMEREAGLPRIVEFLNVWAREMPKLRAVHLARYEDLRRQPAEGLAAILAFLGTPGSEAEVEEAVRYAAFDNMRQLEETQTYRRQGRRLMAGERGNPDSYKVRRAKVGGWRDYFDDAQCAAIDGYVRERLDPLYGYVDAGPSARETAAIPHREPA
jgi:hypothetical protein